MARRAAVHAGTASEKKKSMTCILMKIPANFDKHPLHHPLPSTTPFCRGVADDELQHQRPDGARRAALQLESLISGSLRCHNRQQTRMELYGTSSEHLLMKKKLARHQRKQAMYT